MRVLVIGTNRFSHYKLMSEGHSVILLTRLKSAFTTDLKNEYAALHYLSENASVEEFVAISRALHQLCPFDAVVSFHDDYQEIAIEVCQILRLPSVYSKAEITVCRDKARARKTLKDAGLTKVDFFRAFGVEEVLERIKKFSIPCIIKPINGTASLGVCPIHCWQDVDVWQSSQNGKSEHEWIVERLVKGPEYSIEAFSEAGKHRVVAITEQFNHDDGCVECGHVVPARLPQEIWNTIASYVLEVLTCLAIRNGPTHTEIKLTADGPEFIETHTRTAGDRIPELVALTSGVDLNELAARQVTGQAVLEQIPLPIEYSCNASIAFKFVSATHPSMVNRIDNLEKLEGLTEVKDIKLYKEVGSQIHQVLHSHDRAAHVICVDSVADEAIAKARYHVETLEYHLCADSCPSNS